MTPGEERVYGSIIVVCLAGSVIGIACIVIGLWLAWVGVPT